MKYHESPNVNRKTWNAVKNLETHSPANEWSFFKTGSVWVFADLERGAVEE
jgi:hypothetical protein